MPRPRLCQLRKRDRGRQRFPDDEGFAEGGRMNRPWRRPTTEQAPGSKRRPPRATMWTKLEDAPPSETSQSQDKRRGTRSREGPPGTERSWRAPAAGEGPGEVAVTGDRDSV